MKKQIMQKNIMQHYVRYILIALALVGFSLMASSMNACIQSDAATQEDKIMMPATQLNHIRKHVIEIHNMEFKTKTLSLQVGDTVTWINTDVIPHTATAVDNSWDSGLLNEGESFTLTINDQTTLDYLCLYHKQMKAQLLLNKIKLEK